MPYARVQEPKIDTDLPGAAGCLLWANGVADIVEQVRSVK